MRNFDHRTPMLRLTCFEADFADMFEVRGHRARRAAALPRRPRADASDRVQLRGLAGDVSRTIVKFAPAPTLLEPGEAVFELTLEPTRA